MKIIAVVVTHNRRKLLERCLDCLLAQSRPPEDILVVNNGSTDDTVSMLQQRGIAFVSQENVGSAGGWHRGIDHALSQGFDAIWLMDDDGYPHTQALATLSTALRSNVVCASSVVVREDDSERFVFPLPRLDKHGLPVIWGLKRKIPTLRELRAFAPSGFYPFAHFFNGALLSTAAVRRIGNVDPAFFIFGDEVDYFFRLRGIGEVVSLLDALHFHPDVSRRPYSPAKVYYYLKNTLILNERYFDQKWLRHAAAVAAVLGRTASRNGVGSALSLIGGPSAPTFWSALTRGLRGQVGRDFDG